jgi:hypothetical protein
MSLSSAQSSDVEQPSDQQTASVKIRKYQGMMLYFDYGIRTIFRHRLGNFIDCADVFKLLIVQMFTTPTS